MPTFQNNVTGADIAIVGVSDSHGIQGRGNENGVVGIATTGNGVAGLSDKLFGVKGVGGTAGVQGESENIGVNGKGGSFGGVFESNSHGVQGRGNENGVVGIATTGNGVAGLSDKLFGVKGVGGAAGVRGESTNVGVHGVGTKLAGLFEGDVQVTHNLLVDGDVQLTGADLAEQFGVVGQLAAEPGSVVVLAGDDRVRVSDEPYDHRVAGIVSGAGLYRPGIVLDRQPGANRCALALSGKVWCKVDADCAPIQIGDMLTTSSTPGHAMRATDPARAFGAVIGKALGGLTSGRGLVPVLVTLH